MPYWRQGVAEADNVNEKVENVDDRRKQCTALNKSGRISSISADSD
jgi:hypothetical protein